MKRKFVLLTLCVMVVFLAVLIIQYSSQAQQQGQQGQGRAGGRRGGAFAITRTLNIEQLFSYLCFDQGISDEDLPKVRKLCKDAWDKRIALTKQAEESGEDLTAEAGKIKSDLTTKLEDVLTPEQVKALKKWEQESRQQRGGMPPGMPGGAPGGGGGPGR